MKVCFQTREKVNLKAMFEKLKSGFKGLVSKVTTTELKTESLTPLLSDFKMGLAENDVAFPVADKICDELEKRLVGVSVKRLEDRKKIVEENLKQVLLEVMLTNCRIDLLTLAEEKRKKNQPFSLNLPEPRRFYLSYSSLKSRIFCVRKDFLWYSVVLTLTALVPLNN